MSRWFAHPVIGGIIGVFSGGLTVLLLEVAGHRIFGTGDPANPASITTPMFASVLVAWVAGAGVAGLVATAWTGARSILPGVIAGAVLLGGTIMNLVAFPHPVWMAISAVVLMPAAAWFTANLRMGQRA